MRNKFQSVTRALVCAVALSNGLLVATTPVFATTSGTDRTCAALDPLQGGTAYTSNGDEEFGLMLADGDVLTYSAPDLVIQEPGAGVSQTLSGGGTIIVTALNAGNWEVRRDTYAQLSCQAASVSAPTMAESDNLAAQQDALSSLLMLHHANTMRMGVEENIESGLGGTGQVSGITPNGFAFSSRAMALQDAIGTSTMWNIWARGRLSQYDGDGNSFDGHIGDIFAGVDYRVTENIVVGAMLGFGNTDFSTLINTVNGGFEANSQTVGAYAGFEFSALHLSTSASYTSSDYQNRSGATTGSFSADRLTISANLSGRHTFENDIILEPMVDFLWATERQDGYTDSAAVVHAANRISAGRISVGPRLISPNLLTDGGALRLWSSAMADYDFSNQSPVPTSGLPDLSSLTSLRLSAGLDSQIGRGHLSLRGDAFGLGSGEFTAYGASLAYQLPF